MSNNPLRLLLSIWLISALAACQTSAPPPLQTEAVEAESKVEPSADPADSLYQLAMWSTKAGKTEDAIEQFQLVIDQNPAYPRAYTNLGLLRVQKKQWQEAQQAFEQAISVDENDAIAYHHLGIILREQGQFKPALVNYQKAIELKPDYANAHLNLGILLDLYLQDLPRALEQYQIYQSLTENQNEDVAKWIVDIQRRVEAPDKK